MVALKAKYAFCVGVILVLFILCMQQQVMASDMTIDKAPEIEPANNEMGNDEAQRVFKYAKMLYGDKKYDTAVKAFRAVVDYSKSDLRDDSLYLMGKCFYYQNKNERYVQTFQQVYALFPEGNIVKSNALKRTLLNILEKERVKDFYYLMRTYHLLIKLSPGSLNSAREIVNIRASQPVDVSRTIDFRFELTAVRLRF